MRLMVAGLLAVFMAVCFHFLSLILYEKHLLQHVQNELTQLVSQTELLEKSLNEQLQRTASTEADKIFQNIVSNKASVETSVLYRVINLQDQVIQSNYEKGLPKPFVPNASLYQTFVGSDDQFNQDDIKSLHSSLQGEDSVIYPIRVLDLTDRSDFVLYKPYNQQILIEIFMSKAVEKERVRTFFLEQLDALFQSEKLENLTIYDEKGTLYSGGIQMNRTGKNSGKDDRHDATFTLTYAGQPLFIDYSIGNAASDVFKTEYLFWAIVFYGSAAAGVMLLLKRSSKAVLDPIDMFLNSANDAKLGYYDKRLDFQDYVGFKPLSIGFNEMLDRMVRLLEEKKVQEDRLRQLHLTEQQQEETENIDLEEAFCTETRLRQAVLQSAALYTQLIMTLCSAIEAKDQYTSGHCERVVEWSVKLAERSGLMDQDLEDVKMGALLHDVGKLGLPEELLNKVEPLTDPEWSILKRHTRFGEEILADFNVSDMTKKIVAMHHEQYDGKGYPKGERGQDIPIGARIVCLVDAYDAMSNVRPYRLIPMKAEEIVKELRSQSGKQFDPDLVELLIQLIGFQGGVSYES